MQVRVWFMVMVRGHDGSRSRSRYCCWVRASMPLQMDAKRCECRHECSVVECIKVGRRMQFHGCIIEDRGE